MRTLKEFISESNTIVGETNIFEGLEDIRKKITGTWRNRRNTFIKSDLDAWDWTVRIIKNGVKKITGEGLSNIGLSSTEARILAKELKEYLDDTSIDPNGGKIYVERWISQANIDLGRKSNEARTRIAKNYISSNDIEIIEIDDVDNVKEVNGSIVYTDGSGKTHVFEPSHTIVRKCKKEANSNDNAVVYINKSIDEMREATGLTRPEAVWYSDEYGSDYNYTSGISVKNWMRKPSDKRYLADNSEPSLGE